jgi:hypothetical protein
MELPEKKNIIRIQYLAQRSTVESNGTQGTVARKPCAPVPPPL